MSINIDDNQPDALITIYDNTDGRYCSICYELKTNEQNNIFEIILPCGHSFCNICINNWRNTMANNSRSGVLIITCPMCRAPDTTLLNPNEIRRQYGGDENLPPQIRRVVVSQAEYFERKRRDKMFMNFIKISYFTLGNVCLYKCITADDCADADADADVDAGADVDADACIENGDTHYVTELDVSDDILMDDVIEVDYMTDVVAHSQEIDRPGLDHHGLDHHGLDHHVHMGLVEHINSFVGHMLDNIIHC